MLTLWKGELQLLRVHVVQCTVVKSIKCYLFSMQDRKILQGRLYPESLYVTMESTYELYKLMW